MMLTLPNWHRLMWCFPTGKPHRVQGPRNRRAGQPIAVFLALLFCWVGLRAAIWESPFPDPVPATVVAVVADGVLAPGTISDPALLMVPSESAVALSIAARRLVSHSQTALNRPPPRPLLAAIALKPSRPAMAASTPFGLTAAMGQMPVPQIVAEEMSPTSKPPQPAPLKLAKGAASQVKRWSVDGWVFLRPNTTGVSITSGSQIPSYGASQAGAVLRYRLSPGSKARPTAYARGTTAFGAGDNELALGLAARLVPALPIAAHVEARLTRNSTNPEVRPAAFLVTELPPLALPLGVRAEAYLAAGYVGGDFATPFADGQARIDREVARLDLVPPALSSLRTGLGVWGGAQEGAARLDVGPSASLNVEVATVPARLSLDYRLRVAGNAEPGSGVALTLSTGF